MLKGYDIKIEVQKNSNESLVSLYNYLSLNFKRLLDKGLSIKEVYINVFKNKVILTLDNKSEFDLSFFDNYVNQGLLEIRKTDNKLEPTDNLIAGKKVYDDQDSTSSLGFSAIRNGIEGVIVSGHANDIANEPFHYLYNSSIYEIGTVLAKNYQENSDCAFIKLENASYNLSNYIANGNQFSDYGTVFIAGLGCSSYGQFSGEDSGIILTESYTFKNSEDVILTDHVKVDIPRNFGDSGGPLYRATGSDSEILMGILSSKSDSGYSIYSKVEHIIDDLDLDSIYLQ